MIQIDQWFPIHIGCVINPFHEEIENELTQQCVNIKKSYKKDFEKYRKKDEIKNSSQSPLLDWLYFQQNSPYNLLEDQKFNRLHNWIDDQIGEYTEKLKFKRKVKCSEGWFNVYEKYEYADYHSHIPNILSCVYFLNCEEKGAKLLIRNKNDALVYHCDIVSIIYHHPIPGKLVIFSSHLEHAVQQHNTDNLRITLAYNYV